MLIGEDHVLRFSWLGLMVKGDARLWSVKTARREEHCHEAEGEKEECVHFSIKKNPRRRCNLGFLKKLSSGN